ncbi:MAG: transglutaminase domain-containing protein [Anaerolineales bacterium]|nr:MAG: transglutaminase domain-containing protein [Anaerolineales bacterium]
MSRLYYSETGHVVPTLCEELTDYRHARKILHLPATSGPATLFFLARSYPGHDLPLRLSVNGAELPSLQPNSSSAYMWHEVQISPSLLLTGANMFEFWTDAPAMDAWSLAIENGHQDPRSFVSTDSGLTWRNHKMGYLNTSRGEYLVRIRLAEGTDPPPPSIVWEDMDNPRLGRLRQAIPNYILQAGTTMARVRALTSWVCTSWEYRNSGDAAQYAPWDVETVVAWGQASRGHDGRKPIVMCVHYGVALVSYCIAAGIPARCAAFTGSINGFNGHFTAEVWFEEFDKWVMVDPTLDAILFKDDVPLSVKEIQEIGPDMADMVEWGPGYKFQLKNPVMAEWTPNIFLTGICFGHRGLWPRTDFLSHPELSPPGHGSTSYCETSLVWETEDLEKGFGMFPYFGEPDYFNAPPQDFPR